MAQTRIFLDEQSRFDHRSRVAIYNIPLLLQVCDHSHVSISRLRDAVDAIIRKHEVLRTRVAFDHIDEKNTLCQTVLDSVSYPFEISSLVEANLSIEDILEKEETDPSLFNVEQGLVFRCHIWRHGRDSSGSDLLKSGDLIIFNFHHIAFDGTSADTFLHELAHAYHGYDIGALPYTYIDYAMQETQMNWEASKMFWQNLVNHYQRSQVLDLPYDRKPQNVKGRSGRSIRTTFKLSNDLVTKIMRYTHEKNATLFHFGLAAFYSFLFRITGDRDLCIATTFENRLRPEEAHMIGFFVNTVPYRLLIDPCESFDSITQRIKSMFLSILPHAHFPYQNIISIDHIVQTLFVVEDIDENQVITLDDKTRLQSVYEYRKSGNIQYL